MLYMDPKTVSVTKKDLRSYRCPTLDELGEMRRITNSRHGQSGKIPAGLGKKWKPIAHPALLTLVEDELTDAGFDIVDAQFQIDRETGHDVYALWTLDAKVDMSGTALAELDIKRQFGMKHSNRQRFSLLGLEGATVGLCANGIATGNSVFDRKHTNNLDIEEVVGIGSGDWAGPVMDGLDRLPRLIGAMAEHDFGEGHEADKMVSWTLCEAARRNYMSWSQTGKCWSEWVEPRYDAFEPRTAWSLYNSVNQVAKSWSVTNVEKGLLGWSDLLEEVTAGSLN